jgi:two-component system CheB/CheR fusion protein
MLPHSLRILHLEDNPTDRDLVAMTLERSGFTPEIHAVAEPGEYLSTLREGEFDLIFSDYSIPGYSGDAALNAARELRPETPFIFVSGTMGEDLAITSLKNGATDYVLKTSLARLGSSVRRALREVSEAKAHRAANDAVRRSQETLSFALDAAEMGIWDWNISTDELALSERCRALYGLPPDEPVTFSRFLLAIHPDDRRAIEVAVANALAGKTSYEIECRAVWPDGSTHWIISKGRPIYDEASGKPTRMAGAAMDITMRVLSEESMRRSEALLRSITDHTEDIIFVKDRESRVMFMNPAGLRANGHTAGELLGRTDVEWHHDPVEAARFMADDRRVMESRRTENFEEAFTGPNGQRHIFLTTKTPRLDQAGNVIGIIGISRDITERQAADEALRAARDAAEDASKAKDEFLAALSHELRTPLTPVMLSAGALRRDERLPPEVREQIEMIVRNITLEARLIDDLLDLTRIARGNLVLRISKCDAHVLLSHSLEIVRNEIVTKELHLDVDFGAACSWVEADPTRLQQVFWNLLMNAIKFTPAGGRIRVSTRNEAGRLWVEVADTGIGIAPEMCERIFAPFEQAGLANDHRFGGLGLGLAISKAVMDQHGGSITAVSDGAGGGATFRLELPTSAEAPAPAKPEARAEGEIQVPPLRLLIVEDHEPTLETLVRLLARAGHHVTRAASITAAIEAASAASFDVLISDIGLPDGDGSELLPRLRALHPQLQAIILSGYGADEDIRKSWSAGYLIHLTKPIDFAELKRALHDIAPTPVC